MNEVCWSDHKYWIIFKWSAKSFFCKCLLKLLNFNICTFSKCKGVVGRSSNWFPWLASTVADRAALCSQIIGGSYVCYLFGVTSFKEKQIIVEEDRNFTVIPAKANFHIVKPISPLFPSVTGIFLYKWWSPCALCMWSRGINWINWIRNIINHHLPQVRIVSSTHSNW